jgi:hypothetical protein
MHIRNVRLLGMNRLNASSYAFPQVSAKILGKKMDAAQSSQSEEPQSK